MKEKVKLMKNRNIIFGAILSVLACVAFLPQMLAQDDNFTTSNTPEGFRALFNQTDNTFNTGVGWLSLFTQATAQNNTGVGAGTLALNDTGNNNTAAGAAALEFNTSGSRNNAVGSFALLFNVDGSFNNAHGSLALFANTTGIENEALGDQALLSATTASGNVAVGDNAGLSLTTSSENTLIGKNTGLNLDTFGGNIYIGTGAGGPADEVAFIRIGTPTFTDPVVGTVPYDTFISGIKDRFVELATAEFVFVDGNQKLGTELVDAQGNSFTMPIPQGALAPGQAPEAAKHALLDLKVKELQATVAQQQKQIEALNAGLQKVSAQIEVSKPAPQVVVNKP